MAKTDMTLVAVQEQNKDITAWIRGFPELVVQGRRVGEVRGKLKDLLRNHFQLLEDSFADAPCDFVKLTKEEERWTTQDDIRSYIS